MKVNSDKCGYKTTETLSGISVTCASMPVYPEVHLNFYDTSSFRELFRVLPVTQLLTDRISISFIAVGVKESFPAACSKQGEEGFPPARFYKFLCGL